MEFYTHSKLTLLIAALLLNAAMVSALDCQRLAYYGSPINYIHKAHEDIHEILQYAKVDTSAFFIGSAKTFDLASNTVWEDYLYYINDGATAKIKKLLAVRISSKNSRYFVDEYAMLDIISATVASYNYILTTRFKLATVVPKIPDFKTLFECRLIKEEFTYFYEMYPSRFQKVVS